MPALPELNEVTADEGIVEVLLDIVAEERGEPDRDVAVAGKVEVEAQREGVEGEEAERARVSGGLGQDRVRPDAEVVRHEQRTHETEQDALEAAERARAVEARPLGSEVLEPLDGPGGVGGQEGEPGDDLAEAGPPVGAACPVHERRRRLEDEIRDAEEDDALRGEDAAPARPALVPHEERGEGDETADDEHAMPGRAGHPHRAQRGEEPERHAANNGRDTWVVGDQDGEAREREDVTATAGGRQEPIERREGERAEEGEEHPGCPFDSARRPVLHVRLDAPDRIEVLGVDVAIGDPDSESPLEQRGEPDQTGGVEDAGGDERAVLADLRHVESELVAQEAENHRGELAVVSPHPSAFSRWRSVGFRPAVSRRRKLSQVARRVQIEERPCTAR